MLFIAGLVNFCTDAGQVLFQLAIIYHHITSTTSELVQDVQS